MTKQTHANFIQQKMSILACLSMTLASLLPVPLTAQTRANTARFQTIQMVAREQPLAAFLTDLYGQMGTPVAISPNVNRLGYVNGHFNKAPTQIYSEIASAFGLVNYFDGTVMHIVTAGEVQTRTYSPGVKLAARLISNASQLGFINSNNKLRSTASGMVFATGTRRFIEQIEEMMKAEGSVPANSTNSDEKLSEELPVPGVTTRGANGMAIKVFYLRYAWAQDNAVASGSRQTSIPGIASIVRSLVSAKPSTANYNVSNRRRTRPKLSGQGLAGVGREQEQLGYSTSYGDNSGQNQPQASGLPQVASLPETGDDGGDPSQVKVEADSRLNAVIIRDRRDRMPMYEQLIRQLDVEPQLVEIEATIIDVNTDLAQKFGINWRFNDGKQDILFGNGTASDTGLLNLGAAITPVGSGLSISTVIGSANQFISRINLLAQKGAARVVTRPQVMTLSNIEAIFDDSDTFYVRVAGREQVDLFDVSVGTTLRVLPHVFRDKGENRIRMMISIEDGKIRPGLVDGIPVVNRSGITTQAIMLQGQSLLIGGLVQDVREKSEGKVPVAGDLPLVGNLFKSTNKRETRIERLFLISPRLASVNAPRTQPTATPQEYLPPIVAAPKTYTPKQQRSLTSLQTPVLTPLKPAATIKQPMPSLVQINPVRKIMPTELPTLGINTPLALEPKAKKVATKPFRPSEYTAPVEISDDN
jgi:type III secretion protein C